MIHPSSSTRLDFEKEVQAALSSTKPEDTSKHWSQAYRLFNGLAMFEMLPALVGFQQSVLNSFWAQHNSFAAPGEIPRMQYAMDVVVNGEVPDIAPGDLVATNQEKWAMEFLNDDNPPTKVPFANTSLTFSQLMSWYPQGSPESAKQTIGGKVDADWITNTCAVRLSRALNYGGLAIPKDQPGLDVISGGDKKWYSYRMRQLGKFLETKIGSPSIELKRAPFKRKRFGEMTGIIRFEIHFSDASGHLDLWDGKTFTHEATAGKDYFQLATEIAFWRLK
jgi:hypothetical protein